MKPDMFLHVKTVGAIAVTLLAASGIFWRNSLEIARLRDEVRTVQIRLDQVDKQARQLEIRTALVEEKLHELKKGE